MIVTDSSGETWRVKRRWLPWRLRKRDPDQLVDSADVGNVGGVDDLVIGLAILAVVILVLIVAPVVIVLAVVIAEALLLLLLLPLFVVLRAGYVARWPIEAWRGRDLVHAEAVRGWGASHRRMVAMVDGIRAGELPTSGASPTA